VTANSKNKFKVPLSAPDITDAERQALMQVLSTNHFSMGPQVEAFEYAMRAAFGVKHAIAVSSGTTGLHLCVLAAGIQDGDLVLTTPFSFMASSNVLLYERAVPVFVDVDPRTGNIDPVKLAQAAADITAGGETAQKWLPRTGVKPGAKLKAILPVDVFGQPADMDPIQAVARQYGLKVIEDSCEALGARYKDQFAGRMGDYGVFAFYPNKQITTAEGGMIVTDDDAAADLMRALRNQGRAPGDTWLEHSYLGYNYRLDEFSAALGAAQMGRLQELLEKRARVAHWYHHQLEALPQIERPEVADTTTRMSWFVYVVRLPQGVNRDKVIHDLETHRIPARAYFAPIHTQHFMRERFGYQPGDYPITEDLGARGLALPFSSVMTEEEVALVVAALQQVL
jgi:dTDP-4-amino-4,6-dideoxygalactose transaminase